MVLTRARRLRGGTAGACAAAGQRRGGATNGAVTARLSYRYWEEKEKCVIGGEKTEKGY